MPDTPATATHTATVLDQTGPISHDEAKQIADRYNRSHWWPRVKGERARYSIPADPHRDDDIRLSAYIAQQEARDPALAAMREALARYGVHKDDCNAVNVDGDGNLGSCDCGLDAALRLAQPAAAAAGEGRG